MGQYSRVRHQSLQRGHFLRAALALLLSTAAGTAVGEIAPAAAPAPQPRWEWGVGIGAAWLRDYPGSSHERAYALPYPWFTWRSEHVELGREGGRGVLFRARGMEVDFTLSANPPARSDDNPERNGMPTLDAVVEPGLRARWRYWLDEDGKWRLDLRVPVRVAHTVDDRVEFSRLGAHVEPGLSLEHRMSPAWSWALFAGVGFAEGDYVDYYYGVPAAYATPARPAWQVDGGYAGWQAGGRISWRHDDFTGGLFLRVENVDDASFSDSPLVTTPWGVSVGLNLSWRLGRSKGLTHLDES